MNIQRLPDGMIIQISNQLDSQRDLSNLAVCCHDFYRLTVPVLYSIFSEVGGQKMLKFLLTIIARPDLAPYVKALLCVGPHTYKGEKPTLIADDARSRIKAELSKAGVKEDMRDSWCEKLCDLAKDGAWEATIALLMLLLPNLSTLGMPRYHETE
jgi:hypothetical protein